MSARLNLSCVEEQRFVIELRLNRFQKVKRATTNAASSTEQKAAQDSEKTGN